MLHFPYMSSVTSPNLQIDAAKTLPRVAFEIVQTASGHVTLLNAGSYLPDSLHQIARAGGAKVTLRFGP